MILCGHDLFLILLPSLLLCVGKAVSQGSFLTASVQLWQVVAASRSGRLDAVRGLATSEEKRLDFVRQTYDRVYGILLDMCRRVDGIAFRPADVGGLAREMSDCFEQGGHDMGDVFVKAVMAHIQGAGSLMFYREVSV